MNIGTLDATMDNHSGAERVSGSVMEGSPGRIRQEEAV
jgi:hypothetical protein